MFAGYRDAELRETCVVCGELAEAACERCAKPYCKTHENTMLSGLCGDCEAEWQLTPEDPGRTWAVAALGAALAGCMVVGGILAMPLAAIGVAAGGLAAFGGIEVHRARAWARRQREFIAQGAKHDRLRALLASTDQGRKLLASGHERDARQPGETKPQLPPAPSDHSE